LCVPHISQNKQRLLTYTELIDWALKSEEMLLYGIKIFGRHLDEIQASRCLSLTIKREIFSKFLLIVTKLCRQKS
jgi:hypothetical protein